MIKLITNNDKVTLSSTKDNVNITTPQIIAGTGTSDYGELENKPSINGVVLEGDKPLTELGIQPTGDYATKTELAGKQPVGDYATKDELANKQDKGNYATEEELATKQDKGDYATRAELSEKQPVGDYATKAELNGKQDVGDYATRDELNGKQPVGDYATKEELATKQDVGDYALSSEIPSKLPSPFGLTLTGAVSATYDGSRAITVNIPSGGGGGGGSGTNIPIMFNNTYCEDVDTYLTNGYIKTGENTKNLPEQFEGSDYMNRKSKWGVLFFIAENAWRGTGTQMIYPIDGTYKGQVFVRSVTNKVPGIWKILVQADTKINMDDYATKAYVDEQIAKLAK